jgi:hypothetical protein
MKSSYLLQLTAVLCLTCCGAYAQGIRTLPGGTEIKVRTDTAVPANPRSGSAYAATVSNDVLDKSGKLAIPRNSRAQLVATSTNNGKDAVLDLSSVTIQGRKYLITTSSSSKSSGGVGFGMNTKTGKYVGGGAAVGAVLGALLGGGKGAGIGALVGGAGGAGAQAFGGRKKELPAETELTFKTAQDLQLRSVSARSSKPALKSR